MAALGPLVWRTESEGLKEDCIGPSSYAKAQGEGIKIWGLLHRGQFKVHIMPSGQNMTGKYYQKTISSKLHVWIHGKKKRKIKSKTKMIQDNERALWTQGAQKSFKEHQIKPMRIPVSSPDLNPIETVWAHLRDYLNLRPPAEIEKRREFIMRIHNAVKHLNDTKGDMLKKLCTTIKKRAREVISAGGSRTRH